MQQGLVTVAHQVLQTVAYGLLFLALFFIVSALYSPFAKMREPFWYHVQISVALGLTFVSLILSTISEWVF